MLEFNQYMKSDKMPHIIYAHVESLNKKIDGCVNNPENSSTTKIGEHIPCRYSMSTIWALEIKHTLNCRIDCIKTFCESLREHAKCIIDFKNRKMLRLTKEELKLDQVPKVCYFCGEIILKYISKKKFKQLQTIAIIQVNIEVQYIVLVIKN